LIAVDTNILVYAHRRDSGWYDQASACIRNLAEGPEPWGVPWPCIHEFLAIVTHPRIYRPPTPIATAAEQVDIWIESPTVRLLAEHPGYWETLKREVLSAKVVGPAVHDARIAAICRSHGVRELWTADRDFGRFGNLATRNPLIGR
jgi:hypothetical protein